MIDVEQLEALTAENRHAPSGTVERELLRLRTEIFVKRQQEIQKQDALFTGPDGDKYGLPVVPAAELDAETLRRCFAEFGAVHVRGLLTPPAITFMQEVIDTALAADAQACEGAPAEQTFPWFEAFDKQLDGTREHIRSTGSMLAADSPRAVFHLLEMFYDLKIDRLLTEFFGERPGLAVEKTTLRCVWPWPDPSDWHQDGRFLGTNIRSVNIWLALSDCGIDAPSLELVPRRLYRILKTDGVQFDYTTSHAIVEREFGDARIRPEFKAGDALLFDHFLVHRTWFAPTMTKIRYAIESWFFPPSAFPQGYSGLHV